MTTYYYRCSQCGATFDITPERLLCPSCSALQKEQEPLRGVLEVRYENPAPPSLNASLRDFAFGLFPVDPTFFPPIPVGGTPLWEPRRLREELGFPRLYLKDDTLNPTGSLKDRASFLVSAFAAREKQKRIVVASTGNAASSMAGIGAAAGQEIKIFMPASAPAAKTVQARQYGADVVLVEGSYDEAFRLSLEFTRKEGGLTRNTALNPMTIEGKKSAALEIVHQLQGAPDHIFVPVGDGVIIGGLYKGFEDLLRLEIIHRMPTIHAVQAQGSTAISRAYRTGSFSAPEPADTIADSIAVGVPAGGHYAVEKLHTHAGRVTVVSDSDILAAQHRLASRCGLFAEPSSSASLAGFLAARENLAPDASVVLLITGSGLKDIDAAARGLNAETGAQSESQSGSKNGPQGGGGRKE